MGYARIHSVTLLGVSGEVVTVEADLAPGLPGLVVTGLPDAALVESRDRVRAAIVNSGESWPQRRITVNLTPAHLPKHGSGIRPRHRRRRARRQRGRPGRPVAPRRRHR